MAVGVAALLAFVAPAVMAASADAVSPSPTHELTAADVDAWLDGYLPLALAQADIAGAVVVVVKDGQVLTQRGYGYADVAARRRIDPVTTMFRPGSISKLFTWTAVMQLVEEGKIDLDVDVNRYIDFTIPPYDGKPVTMRNIMTHTPGFEASLKHLIIFEGAESVPSLGEALKAAAAQSGIRAGHDRRLFELRRRPCRLHRRARVGDAVRGLYRAQGVCALGYDARDLPPAVARGAGAVHGKGLSPRILGSRAL